MAGHIISQAMARFPFYSTEPSVDAHSTELLNIWYYSICPSLPLIPPSDRTTHCFGFTLSVHHGKIITTMALCNYILDIY